MTNIKKKYFTLLELFASFERGKVHSQNSLPEGNTHFYVGAKKKNNGVMCECGYNADLVSKGNCIVFICNGEGSVGYSLYMDRDFMASGDLILAYGDFLNPYIGLYLVTLLDLERPKYSFGRKYGPHVKATRILLPVTYDDSPDWQYMETFVKDQIIPQLPKKAQKVWLQKYETAPVKDEVITLNKEKWHWFEVGKILQCKATKHSIIYDQQKGSFPLVSRSASNNGIIASVDADVDCLNNGNCITIGAEGLYAFYQPDDFVAGVKVYTLRQANLNPYNAQFLCTILNREVYRYSYGNARILDKIKKEKIKLPAIKNAEGEYEPDWQFMEDYIKSLPYSRNLEPSKPDEVVDELVEMKKEMIKMRRAMEAQQSQPVQIVGGNVTYIDNSTNYNIKK